MTIENMIKENDYLLNTFDLLVLSNYYSFPLAILSTKQFKENNQDYLTFNITKGETYIVRSPVFNKYRRTVPKYKLIINKNNEGLIEIKNLPNEKVRSDLTGQNNTINSLLDGFDNKEEEIKGGKKLKAKIRLSYIYDQLYININYHYQNPCYHHYLFLYCFLNHYFHYLY
jgi:hypothetical protein